MSSQKGPSLNHSPPGDDTFPRELIGLLGLASAIFIAVALLSYAPEDPTLHHYTAQGARNWMGPVGAHLAAFLLDLLGWAAIWSGT